MLLDNRFEFFDLRFETILLGGRNLRVLQLFRRDFDSNFVAGDVCEDSNLAIAGNEQLISERLKPNGDDVVIEDSFDFHVEFTGQSWEKLNVGSDTDGDDLSGIRKCDKWWDGFVVETASDDAAGRFAANVIDWKL